MQKAEYYTNILDNGQIPLPGVIRNQLRLKPDQKIRVILEIPEHRKRQGDRYSFEKVRKLLSGIRGDMSSEILSDRKERV